ncbi:MAG: hypothetical protein LAO31_17570 [Acidobacteriia bacterium]|nr:hypothetical protein [Terriglobia bacterium]
MSNDPPYFVSRVQGLCYNSQKRGIAFLEETGKEDEIDARITFESLKEKIRRNLLSRFEYWISGGVQNKYFHGWPNDARHKECFVFKWKEAGTNHRLYGFLINPRPVTLPAYQVCILCSRAHKKDETDPTILDWMMELRANEKVIHAIKSAIPESIR